MSKTSNYAQSSIENYQKSDSQIKDFFTKEIKKIRIYKTSDNFPLENPKKSDLFPIYKEILEKSDGKNYITMLIMIIQKIHKINLKIKSESNELRMIFKINEKNIKGFLETDLNCVKETKNLFCLKLLVKYYPFFCRFFYFYIHEVLNLEIKSQNEGMEIGFENKKIDEYKLFKNNQDFKDDPSDHKILQESENLKKEISIFDIKENLKKLTIQNENISGNCNFFEFFKAIGFKVKIIIKNNEITEITEICYVIEDIKNSISISILIEIINQKISEALKISKSKLIENLSLPENLEKLTKKFISQKNLKKQDEEKHKDFFLQFKCQITKKKIPINFINSDKKIPLQNPETFLPLSDYNPKENDFFWIFLEIIDICEIEINIEINKVEDKQDVFFYTENDKENGYYFRITFQDINLVQDFAILKFLEFEFFDLFEWILKKKY